ncbi:MAG: hypothetical protein ACLVLH_00445 [Eisenbergiella massiliensis]
MNWRKNSAGPDHIASGRIWREGILHIVWPDGSETPAADIITPAQQKLFDCPLGRKRRGTPLIASGVRPVWDMEYIKQRSVTPCMPMRERWRCTRVELNAEGLRCLAMDDDHEDPDWRRGCCGMPHGSPEPMQRTWLWRSSSWDTRMYCVRALLRYWIG